MARAVDLPGSLTDDGDSTGVSKIGSGVSGTGSRMKVRIAGNPEIPCPRMVGVASSSVGGSRGHALVYVAELTCCRTSTKSLSMRRSKSPRKSFKGPVKCHSDLGCFFRQLTTRRGGSFQSAYLPTFNTLFPSSPAQLTQSVLIDFFRF